MANNSTSVGGLASLWRDPDKRAIIYQVLVVAILIWFVGSIIANTAANMEKRGLASGFDFLDTSAGFGIIS